MKKVLWFTLVMLFIPLIVMADIGPKPSITINLKGINSTDYYIDLLTKMDDSDYDKYEYRSEEFDYRNEPIYLYKDNGWYATTLRNRFLFGKVEGNSEHVHRFTYFGTPDVFKIIVQMPDGSIRVSDTLTRTEFNYEITLDVNNMNYLKNKNVNKVNVLNSIFIFVATCAAEIFIAYCFKLGHYKLVLLVNVISNLLLQALLYMNFMDYNLLFLICEALVIIGEYLVYIWKIKDITNKKILIYTLIANLITIGLSFIF